MNALMDRGQTSRALPVNARILPSLSLLVLACGCGSASDRPSAATPGEPPAKTLPGVTSYCDYDQRLPLGAYDLLNNAFAQNKATEPHGQCLIERQVGGKAQYGWSWAWPGFDPLGFGYPEIVFGQKPWDPSSTDPRLPVRISDVTSMTLRYQTETTATGKHNLSPALWINGAADAAPLTIVAEIAVWLDWSEGTEPIGTPVGQVSVGGVEYGFWHAPNHGDRGDGTGWSLYYFKAATPRAQGTLDFQALLAHMQSEGDVQPSDYVTSLEFGAELQGGSGTTWITDFSVELTTSAPAP